MKKLFAVLAAVLVLYAAAHADSVRSTVSTGTGFIISSDGYILTNEHIISGSTKIIVSVGKTDYSATIVRSNEDKDIALLKIEGEDLPSLPLRDTGSVQIGDAVYAIGCPRGLCGTVTKGSVANLARTELLMDLTLASGSSGGPLLNSNGEVIGITTSVVFPV